MKLIDIETGIEYEVISLGRFEHCTNVTNKIYEIRNLDVLVQGDYVRTETYGKTHRAICLLEKIECGQPQPPKELERSDESEVQGDE